MKKEEFEEKIKMQKEEREKLYMAELEEKEKTRIPFTKCKDGYTYEIDGRNFDLAIFYKEKFHGIRHKFHDKFIDAELHWDTDERFGTVSPLKVIEKVPDEVLKAIDEHDDNTVFEYLDSFITE